MNPVHIPIVQVLYFEHNAECKKCFLFSYIFISKNDHDFSPKIKPYSQLNRILKLGYQMQYPKIETDSEFII